MLPKLRNSQREHTHVTRVQTVIINIEKMVYHETIKLRLHNLGPHLLGVISGKDIGNSLISTRKILVNIHVIANLKEDDGGSEDEGYAEQDPVADKLPFEGEFAGVQVVHDGRTARLDALVETDVVGGATARVGEGAHEPGLVSGSRK